MSDAQQRLTPAKCIMAAIPDADEALCDHILWGRTPFPAGAITPRSLYKAASRFKRAQDHGIRLCDLCDRIAVDGWNCESCNKGLMP